MHKVGILTFHYLDSYGALLQAYALREKLKYISGYNVEIINYVPKNFKHVINKKIYTNFERYEKKIRKLQKFLNQKCGISSPMINSIDSTDFDYYCVGSDQIWNPMWRDDEYFLINTRNGILFSYAASIGIETNSYMWNENLFKKNLSHFDYISLREDSQRSMISSCTGKECSLVIDPVLLHNRKFYEKLIVTDEFKSKSEYVLLYWINHSHSYVAGIEFVNELSRKLNIPVLHSFSENPPYRIFNNIGTMVYSGIEEYLSCIKNAKFVVTNSYHATLFSMIFHIPFFVFPEHSMQSRIYGIRNMFGLDKRVLDRFIPCSQMSMGMDFSDIDKKIVNQRIKSIDFIHKVFGECNEK